MFDIKERKTLQIWLELGCLLQFFLIPNTHTRYCRSKPIFFVTLAKKTDFENEGKYNNDNLTLNGCLILFGKASARV